jgi:hypothetical protein
MPRLSPYDVQALTQLLVRQDGIISRVQATQCGLTPAALRHRIRLDGPWQVILPGVYHCASGALTARQRVMAAVLYAAGQPDQPDIAVTGPAALAWHQIPAVPADHVDVLVPPHRRRRDADFARLHPTSVEPAVAFRDGALVYVPPARAVADTVRGLRDLADIRTVVAASVQHHKVGVGQLAEELDRGPVQGSRRLRQVLAEVADGVRSAAEADLVILMRRARLPMPLLNPRLYVGDDFLACPDAWWPDYGVAAEVDSREWHLSPAHWAATLDRHARMSAHGLIVLHYPSSRIRTAGPAVVAEIRQTLDATSGRALPAIRTVPAAGRPA